MPQRSTAVVGGGIAGLAAAWELSSAPGVAVTLYEPGRLGGQISTGTFCGLPVDEGPDAFLARVPHAIQLATELGMEAELIAPSARRAMILSAEGLRPLPEGGVLGVPKSLRPLLKSQMLSTAGLLRASVDLVLPRRRPSTTDQSVSDLVGARLGRQVVDRLVDPLVGGIHAGRTDELSAAATVPQLVAAASGPTRSLMVNLRRAAVGVGAASAPDPVFLAPVRGMSEMATRLVDALVERGVHIVRSRVTSLAVGRPGGVGGWNLITSTGSENNFDAVVVATPAPASAELLAGVSPVAARSLRAIPMSSVSLLTLGYPSDSVRVPDDMSGFLVPRRRGLTMTACSFGTNKWPHWSHPGVCVLRLSAGRIGDDRHLSLSDSELVRLLRRELSTALGQALPEPVEWRLTRWPNAFPQYLVGHLDRIAEAETNLAAMASPIALAGSALRGSGIPACIASGRRAARQVLSSLPSVVAF